MLWVVVGLAVFLLSHIMLTQFPKRAAHRHGFLHLKNKKPTSRG